MPWIESHSELRDHPKVFRLMAEMGWDLDTALGKLHRFWWWGLAYALDGDLRKFNDAQIGAAVCVDIAMAPRFVAAMVASCWIDREPYFRIHDWWDYVGPYLKTKWKDKPERWKAVQALYATDGATAPVTDGATGVATRTTRPDPPDQTLSHPPPPREAGGIPKDEAEAVAMCATIGVKPEFVSMVFHQASGRDWRDGSGQAITRFAPHVAYRWAREQSEWHERKNEPNGVSGIRAGAAGKTARGPERSQSAGGAAYALETKDRAVCDEIAAIERRASGSREAGDLKIRSEDLDRHRELVKLRREIRRKKTELPI